jgi:hypothetical protein
METKEYIVILHSYTDLDDFYTDMEQAGHYDHVPNRAVDLVHRRPSSRSTHYQLTDDEVQMLKQDPRVLDIERPYYDLGVEIRPCLDYYYDKDTILYRGRIGLNWGLLRCVDGFNRPNWGWDGINGNPTGHWLEQATINLPNTGRNVDVVVVDGHILPNHPEFAKNADGTGDSRVNQLNWFQWKNAVVGGGAGNYVYDFLNTQAAIHDNNHGCHVAGIVAGNTNGWARDATIYNISPYGTTRNNVNPAGIPGYALVGYIRQFHKNKKINEATGRRNPTIVNMSYAFGTLPIEVSTVQSIVYRGETIDRTSPRWDNSLWNRAGIKQNGQLTTQIIPAFRQRSVDEEIRDAIAEGIIFVGAAGNASIHADVPGGDLYNNQINFNDGTDSINYMRGYSPGSAPGVICVGATDTTVAERRAKFSNVGKRVDIYAPGTSIISSVNAQIEDPITTTVIFSPPYPEQSTYTFTSYPTSVNEGTTVGFTIGTTGVPVDTRLTWKLNFENRGPGYKSIDVTNDVRSYSGLFSIAADGTGKFSVEFIADLWTEGLEVFRVEIRRDAVLTPEADPVSIPVAITPYINLNDTSTGTQFPKGIDPRNNSFFRDMFDGTSMASPQVAGIIACALETYPNMTAAQALSYIQGYANDGVLYDLPFDSTFGEFYFGLVNRYKLFNGPNKYATYKPNTRPNQVYPVIDAYQSRPVTGPVYPRLSPKIQRPTPAPPTSTTPRP